VTEVSLMGAMRFTVEPSSKTSDPATSNSAQVK